jgi:hypothetical protein
MKNENQIFPQEQPFTIVQNKQKSKQNTNDTTMKPQSINATNQVQDITEDSFLKNTPTTPLKDKNIRAPFIIDPDYTFGTQIIQNDMNINTPQLNETKKLFNTTTSLRPNGGRVMPRKDGVEASVVDLHSQPEQYIHQERHQKHTVLMEITAQHGTTIQITNSKVIQLTKIQTTTITTTTTTTTTMI